MGDGVLFVLVCVIFFGCFDEMKFECGGLFVKLGVDVEVCLNDVLVVFCGLVNVVVVIFRVFLLLLFVMLELVIVWLYVVLDVKYFVWFIY